MVEATDSQQKTSRIAIIIGFIVYSLALCLWAVLMGVLLLSYTFEAVPFIYITMLCYPFAIVSLLILSTILYTQAKFRESLILLIIPLLCGLVTFGSYFWLWFNP